MQGVPWPWPLAPLVLLTTIGLAAIVLRLVHTHVVLGGDDLAPRDRVAGRERIPLLPTFRAEILPALAVLWLALLAAWSASGAPIFWALVPWASVTLIMLWPVARDLEGEPEYLSYRTWLFLLGVWSMGYIVVTGIALESDLPYGAKLVAFLLLPVVLTVFGILPSLRAAIGRPLPIVFRPDLIFGDGRVLATGTLSLILGLRYLVGMPPPDGVSVPLPAWNWWAILWAIALGFVPIIAIRGMLKVLQRVRRIRDGVWRGWTSIALRELLLVAGVLGIAFGFHNVFMGTAPFVASRTAFHELTWVPLLGIALGTAFLVFVRGGYKRAIGEPFIRETLGQTWVKELLYVAGILVVAWSAMSILATGIGDVQHAGYRHITAFGDQPAPGAAPSAMTATRWPESGFVLGGLRGLVVGPWNWVGLALVAWGVFVLVPFRVLAQHEQRRALVAQMAAVILPSFSPDARERALRKVLAHLAQMSARRASRYVQAMLEGLDAAPAPTRALMARERVRILAALPEEDRDHLIACMRRALGKCDDAVRIRAMADTMAAVAGLPEAARRSFVERMTAPAA